MKINPKNLSDFYQSYISQKLPTSRKDCPTVSELINSFEIKTSRRIKSKIIDHITKCAACAKEFDLIRMVKADSEEMSREIVSWLETTKPAQDSPAPSINKFAFPAVVWKYAAGAIGLLFLSLSLSLLLLKNSTFVIKKEVNGRREVKEEIQLAEPVNGKASKSRLKFSWRAYPEATSYTLELLDESLQLVWKSPKLKETQYHFPPASLRELMPDHTYFWMITVMTKNGNILESPLIRFLLTE